MAVYSRPPSPVAASASAGEARVRHGALRSDAVSSARQKCTTVGVPNALIVSFEPRGRTSFTSAMTTNCNPVSAAADEPTIT